jgi:hypothetical protein
LTSGVSLLSDDKSENARALCFETWRNIVKLQQIYMASNKTNNLINTTIETGILRKPRSGNTALNQTTPNMSQHVPAWKKIGLKLKYAKETADDTPTISTTTETNGDSHAGAKRSRDEDVEQENPSKRNKTRELRLESPAPRSILSGSQSPTKTPASKKAVSFSAETKAEDGETGQNYFKAWAAGNQPHTPPKPSTEILVPETPESAEKPTTDSPAGTKAKTKASKREKKAEQAASQPQDVEGMPSLQERRESKAAKKAAKQERKAVEAQSQLPATSSPAAVSSTSTAVPATAAPPSAYVDFLHQFHHDRPNWKFNKSKENHLLKNVWSMYRVPAPYTEALVAYVAGLQGAGARTRLVEGADEVLRDVAEKGGRKFDFNGFEEPATRREAYTNAVDSLAAAGGPSGNLEQADLDRAARAQAVLTQLLNYAPLPVTIEKPAKPAAAPKPAAPAVQQPIALQNEPPVRPPPVMVAPPPPPTANDRDQRRVVWTAEKIAAAGGAKRIQFDDDDDEPAPAPKPKPAAAAKPARRRRKARTDVSSSEESSSDSSSSDSSSDSDSD